jgi:hypothetical protein
MKVCVVYVAGLCHAQTVFSVRRELRSNNRQYKHVAFWWQVRDTWHLAIWDRRTNNTISRRLRDKYKEGGRRNSQSSKRNTSTEVKKYKKQWYPLGSIESIQEKGEQQQQQQHNKSGKSSIPCGHFLTFLGLFVSPLFMVSRLWHLSQNYKDFLHSVFDLLNGKDYIAPNRFGNKSQSM